MPEVSNIVMSSLESEDQSTVSEKPKYPEKGSIASTIFGGESGGNYGVYNYFTGKGRQQTLHSGRDKLDYENLTVGDLMDRQKKGEVFAAGAYQVIPSTLKDAVTYLKIDPNTKFNKETQDKIFSGYLAGKGHGHAALEDYVTGKSNNATAALNTSANEWASIANSHGVSQYEGPFNHATISNQRYINALHNARTTYADNADKDYTAALFGSSNKNYDPVPKDNLDSFSINSWVKQQESGPAITTSGRKGHPYNDKYRRIRHPLHRLRNFYT